MTVFINVYIYKLEDGHVRLRDLHETAICFDGAQRCQCTRVQNVDCAV